jgi:hypothetical protein
VVGEGTESGSNKGEESEEERFDLWSDRKGRSERDYLRNNRREEYCGPWRVQELTSGRYHLLIWTSLTKLRLSPARGVSSISWESISTSCFEDDPISSVWKRSFLSGPKEASKRKQLNKSALPFAPSLHGKHCRKERLIFT